MAGYRGIRAAWAWPVALALAALPARADGPGAGAPRFEPDVLPVLTAHCLKCHGAGKKPRAGLDLRSAAGLLRGGESGPAVVPGSAEKSLLVQMVRKGEMPPSGNPPLSAAEAALLRRWIDAGAAIEAAPAATDAAAARVTEQDRAFWAFRKPVRPRPGHFPARARAVVHFMQNGGPSQMDLFDPKPELQKRGGQCTPRGVEIYQKGNSDKLLASPFQFHRRGRCGMELSEALPCLGEVADAITLARSLYTEHNNHTEALVMPSTCKLFQGRPSVGAWVSYALGTENQNLPAYVVLRDPAGYNTSGKLVWSSGWLPALYQGTEFNTVGPPVLNLQPARPVPPAVQRDSLAFLAELNQEHLRQYPRETELEARIRNYELAARMQLRAAEALDLSRETAATRTLYGLDDPVTAAYGMRCLMARRLVEAGVRFVQVFPPVGQPWDAHTDVKAGNEKICAVTDRPVAGFLEDLKGRGLLDGTAVLWTGEFGRLPVSQNGKGRDHNRNAFSLWLAGGGFRAGHVHGATDDFGYAAVEGRVSVPDLHATILHQLGLDHRRLAYPYRGREETLTDSGVTKARVVAPLLERPPEIREEVTAAEISTGLSGSRVIGPKAPE